MSSGKLKLFLTLLLSGKKEERKKPFKILETAQLARSQKSKGLKQTQVLSRGDKNARAVREEKAHHRKEIIIWKKRSGLDKTQA